jgi:hypothetical protein
MLTGAVRRPPDVPSLTSKVQPQNLRDGESTYLAKAG